VFQLRRSSLVRAIAVSLTAFAISLRLGGFPDINALHSSRWQLVPVVMAFGGMIETMRCAPRQWNLYYAGVLILLYTEMMILAMAVFLFFYP